MPLNIELSPVLAVFLVLIAVASGHRYRKAWVAEGSRLSLWCYGLVASLCLLALGFIPLAAS